MCSNACHQLIIAESRITILTVLEKKNDLCCPGYTVARTTEAGLEYYKAKTPHEKRKKKAMDDDK